MSGQTAVGYAADRYAPVRSAFEQGCHDFGDGGGAFCAYVDGVKVVDVWAGEARPGEPWTAETMTTLMSATKGLVALCAQVLCDRGQLDVDAPVSTYWPEFAQAGKQNARVRHVLDHTVGVIGIPDPATLLDWDGGGWSAYEEIAKRLAAAEPAWEPGTKIGYHAITCGWLTGELVRRVTGRTIGAFFRDEIALPLGLDAWIGTPPEHQHRIAQIIGESYDGVPEDLLALDRSIRALFNDPSSPMSQAAIHMHGSNMMSDLVGFMNTPAIRQVELPATNGTATAEGLARVYAMLSMGGELDEVRIVSAESVDLFRRESARGPSAITPAITLPDGQVVPPPFTSYALGYAYNNAGPTQPPVFGPTPETFGHAGHGGQIGMCDPIRRIAIGYVRNHLAVVPTFAVSLIDAMYACAPPQ